MTHGRFDDQCGLFRRVRQDDDLRSRDVESFRITFIDAQIDLRSQHILCADYLSELID